MATHHRHPSTHSTKRPLPPHARPSKPAPLTKRSHSYGHSKSAHRAVPHREEDHEEEESMATSFLQYCTTCEKQIIVPNNSVLYCSESCRKKDNEKVVSYPLEHYSPPPTPFASFSFDDFQFRDIVAPRSPTTTRSQRSSIAFSELSSDENTISSDEKYRSDSEASKYLRQFQSTETSVRPSRPRLNRASTSQVTFSNAPSLTHTPASSVSYSLPYTPSTRPLPPRTNPYSSSHASKSIDLVTPLAIATTAPSSLSQYSLKTTPVSHTNNGTAEGEIRYEKAPIASLSPASGSLRSLFAAR